MNSSGPGTLNRAPTGAPTGYPGVERFTEPLVLHKMTLNPVRVAQITINIPLVPPLPIRLRTLTKTRTATRHAYTNPKIRLISYSLLNTKGLGPGKAAATKL